MVLAAASVAGECVGALVDLPVMALAVALGAALALLWQRGLRLAPLAGAGLGVAAVAFVAHRHPQFPPRAPAYIGHGLAAALFAWLAALLVKRLTRR